MAINYSQAEDCRKTFFEEGITCNNQNESSINLLTDPINIFKDIIKIRINNYKET